jgi:hypothetical protein
VLRGHADRLAQAEPDRALEVRLLVAEVGLVDDEDDRLAAAAKPLGDPVVESRDLVQAVAKPTCFSEAAMIAADEVSPSLRPRPPVSISV